MDMDREADSLYWLTNIQMDEMAYCWADRQLYRCTSKPTNMQKSIQTDGVKDRHTHGKKNTWIERYTIDRQQVGQMYRQKVMYMDRQLDEQMYGYVDKQKDGEKDVKTDRLKQEDIYDANVKLQLLSTKSFKALLNRPQ